MPRATSFGHKLLILDEPTATRDSIIFDNVVGASAAAYDIPIVSVTSFQINGSSGDDVPVDEITLNYGKIVWSYQPIGDNKAGYGDTLMF